MIMNTTKIEKYGTSILRHALTAGGAILIAHGLGTPAEVAAVSGFIAPKVVGSVLYILGQGWSLFEKKKDIEEKEDAVAL